MVCDLGTQWQNSIVRANRWNDKGLKDLEFMGNMDLIWLVQSWSGQSKLMITRDTEVPALGRQGCSWGNVLVSQAVIIKVGSGFDFSGDSMQSNPGRDLERWL